MLYIRLARATLYSAGTIILCLSVSVTSRSFIELDGRIELFFWHKGISVSDETDLSSTCPILCVLLGLYNEIKKSTKVVINCGLGKFRHGISIVA